MLMLNATLAEAAKAAGVGLQLTDAEVLITPDLIMKQTLLAALQERRLVCDGAIVRNSCSPVWPTAIAASCGI